jgi:Leucine-rich repeat (LRR) protein
VHCGDADGRVTSLDLGSWGLESAGLDPALFDLTSLRYLNLAWNNFNLSKLPSTGFEQLTNLTSLNLPNTFFSGQVPHNIGRLTNLVSLDLSVSSELVELADNMDRYIEGDLDNIESLAVTNFTSLVANLGSLRELNLGGVNLSQSTDWCDALSMYARNLRVLRLDGCKIHGPICGTFSALRSLSVIDLQGSSLTGQIPDFFANYSLLNVLQLSYNQLEGWVSPEIFEHKKLVTIDLYYNPKLSGSLPNISADSCLQNLLVGRTNFSSTIPSSIGKIRSLKRLGLDAPGFSGNLPSSIGELKSLNTLKVSGLNLVGPMPSWITNLTSLKVLKFSYCGLYGSIPSSIGHLIKLKIFAVMQCEASGEIPPHIFNMTQLEELALGSNNFTGIVELNSLWRLPNLSLLDLSNNKIVVQEGQENSSMVSLPNIQFLNLAACSITKFPSILKHLNYCIGLDLSNNQMHGAIPRWVWENWSTDPSFGLFYLDLSHNNFTSVGYETFLPISLVKLDLSFNMFEGPIPLPQYSAQVLDYSSNMFSSMPHNFSTQLRDTYVFKASRNNLSGNIPTSFCIVSEFLDLSYNTFNGSVPSCLMEDANPLIVLNLKENQLDGELPDTINENCTLELLDISSNRIEGQLPKSLVACKRLEVLAIANNNITGSFPCWMSTLPRLQVLILKHNNFFGLVIPSSAKEKITWGFPSLRILDISYNNFSGTLNKEWLSKLMGMIVEVSNETLVMEYYAYYGQLYHLGTKIRSKGSGNQFDKRWMTFGFIDRSNNTYQLSTELTSKGSERQFDEIWRTLGFLDVSNNAFQGSIPADIGGLVLLDVLNMSHNSFTGPIPSQLGHLAHLESLDLSSNALSGEIPLELASLDSLTTLNLSNNKLMGSIPESPHFMTFSNNSFLGNEDLCGPPLSKVCNNKVKSNAKKKSVDFILFLFVGIGFGVGFAVAVVVAWGIPVRKRA